MKTLAEFIAASFESTVDLFWDYPSHGVATARFGIRDIAVTVTFEESELYAPWRVSFGVERGDTTSAVYAAFEIFNGVMQAIEEFLEVRQPQVLVIVSKNEQLTRIYMSYLQREASRIERLGYSLEGSARVAPYTEFVLHRGRSSRWK